MKKIGLLTIGQSPRVDITPDLEGIWQGGLEIVERGALDGLSAGQIEDLTPGLGETVLVSRLSNGQSVRLAEERLMPYVWQKVDDLQEEVGAIFLLCTGAFPPLASEIPLFEPDLILRNGVRGIIKPGQVLGVIVPEADQMAEMLRRWQIYLPNTIVLAHANPYGGDQEALEAAARSLREASVDLIVLDCLGFSEKMKATVKAIAKKPVIIPRTFVGRMIMEVL